MAHISDCMVDPAGPACSIGLNNYIAREISPKASYESISGTQHSEEKEKEKFVWRMHQPSESRKYQLFPTLDKISVGPGRKSPDPEQAFAIAMAQAGNTIERPHIGTAVRLKAKEQSLTRRRKASVPELGPMTTVQEIAMDSPTIPGRPPLHERSISAPGQNSWRRNVFGEPLMASIPGPAPDEKAEHSLLAADPISFKGADATLALRRRSDSPKRPFSPKLLSLVIPPNMSASPERVVGSSKSRSDDSLPPDVPPKSARMLEGPSPQTRIPFTPATSTSNVSLDFSITPSSATRTPFTPLSSALSLPTSSAPTSATEGRNLTTPNGTSSRAPSPMMGHSRGQSETSAARSGSGLGHRRERSEASVMDRGRPKKRQDGTVGRSPSTKAAQIAEQKAFETLPQGVKASQSHVKFDQTELDALRMQAIGQAAKFEVLNVKDVDSLSRELRALDERCNYLRRTHHSLRSGRRNLHERICTYLRSPRVARFSHESLLKQEEALAELDISIDDWVSKLEQAENRRTRVRQKLLEHVAAALTLPTAAGQESVKTESRARSPRQRNVHAGENTPPRSPTKGSSSPSVSPQRLAAPEQALQVQVPNNEELDRSGSVKSRARQSEESIRIYMGTSAPADVYALLADVEEEINRMGDLSQETLSAVSFEGMKSFSRSATPVAQLG